VEDYVFNSPSFKSLYDRSAKNRGVPELSLPRSGQSLSASYEAFKSNLRAMREVGCALPKKAEVVANFIYGLNKEEQFSELKIQLSNAAHFNLTLPADLSAAYALAGNFYSSHSHSRSNPDRTLTQNKGK
jgi:hypothetical protein